MPALRSLRTVGRVPIDPTTFDVPVGSRIDFSIPMLPSTQVLQFIGNTPAGDPFLVIQEMQGDLRSSIPRWFTAVNDNEWVEKTWTYIGHRDDFQVLSAGGGQKRLYYPWYLFAHSAV